MLYLRQNTTRVYKCWYNLLSDKLCLTRPFSTRETAPTLVTVNENIFRSGISPTLRC